MQRYNLEASDSWEAQQARLAESTAGHESQHRNLRSHTSFIKLEKHQEEAFIEKQERKDEKSRERYARLHHKNMMKVEENPGIHRQTQHGMMIDAGSSGSRLHLYEFDPRVLSDKQAVADAVSGRKLSFPNSNSRWTDRLRPGIASFATLPDDQLDHAIAEYLSPLLDFAKTILQDKQERLDSFPIFFRATAGMRILDKKDRNRVLTAIRRLFLDKTFCPFYFENEFARVLSGEEEAIFGWTGINFVMGNLVEESEGVGTVVNPKQTYGK